MFFSGPRSSLCRRMVALLTLSALLFSTGCARYLGVKESISSRVVDEKKTPTGRTGSLAWRTSWGGMAEGKSRVEIFVERPVEYSVVRTVEKTKTTRRVWGKFDADLIFAQLLSFAMLANVFGIFWFTFEVQGDGDDYFRYVDKKATFGIRTFQTILSFFPIIPWTSMLGVYDDDYISMSKPSYSTETFTENPQLTFEREPFSKQTLQLRCLTEDGKSLYSGEATTNANGRLTFEMSSLPTRGASGLIQLEISPKTNPVESTRVGMHKIDRAPYYIDPLMAYVYRNVDQALEAAPRGDMKAMQLLAQAYSSGEGIARDAALARQWASKAAAAALEPWLPEWEKALALSRTKGADKAATAEWKSLVDGWAFLQRKCATGSSREFGSIPNPSVVQTDARKLVDKMRTLAHQSEKATVRSALTNKLEVLSTAFGGLGKNAATVAPVKYAEIKQNIAGIRASLADEQTTPDALRKELTRAEETVEAIREVGKLVVSQAAAIQAAAKPSVVAGGSPQSVQAPIGADKMELQQCRQSALVIGINAYQHINGLENAVNDARAVADVLKRNYGFHKVHELYDRDATKANILEAVRDLLQNLSPGEDVLIYYAGHGWHDRDLNEGYWVTVEAKEQSEYLSNADIQRYIKAMDHKGAGHVFLIADSCFSGSFVGVNRDVRAIGVRPSHAQTVSGANKYLERLYADKSRQAFTSGGNQPVADGGAEGHSLFAYYLLKTLRNPSYVSFTATELAASVSRLVGHNSDQAPRLGVIKYSGHEGGEFIFIKRND